MLKINGTGYGKFCLYELDHHCTRFTYLANCNICLWLFAQERSTEGNLKKLKLNIIIVSKSCKKQSRRWVQESKRVIQKKRNDGTLIQNCFLNQKFWSKTDKYTVVRFYGPNDSFLFDFSTNSPWYESDKKRRNQ